MKAEETKSFDDAAGLPELLSAMFDGQLTEAHEARLGALLADPETQKRYLDQCFVHALLRRELGFRQLPPVVGDEAAGLLGAPNLDSSLVCDFSVDDHDDYQNEDHHAATRVLSAGPIRGTSLGLAAISAALAASLLFACSALLWSHLSDSGAGGMVRQVTGGPPVLPQQHGQDARATIVAQLVRSYDCEWTNPDSAPADGDRLPAGQRLELRAGLVEIVFDCGARVILQGPASFLPESARSASLSAGKVSVRAEVATAKGFSIRTPAMKTVDLGTEFGLEVSPNGLEQVHVFRGEVEVSTVGDHVAPSPPQRLVEKQGMEVNVNTSGVKLVSNNGERFARSLDEAQIKRHVVAYWRFEDHAVGVLVPESKQGKSPVRGSLDSSINGNDLYTWSADSQPGFSGDTPAPVVTRTGQANAASLDNSAPPRHGGTRDLFTMSAWSRPSLSDLQAITPVQWTIEASVKATKLDRRYQTFVVRDGENVSTADARLTPLAFQVTPQKHFEVLFCDVDKRDHWATADKLTVEPNHWYHVAAVSDGKSLKLYVDALDGKGYVLSAETGLPPGGSSAMARGVGRSNDPFNSPPGAGYPHIWSVGRGYYNSLVCNWFQGLIDEVRICDVALEPAEFLFARPATAVVESKARTTASEGTAKSVAR